MSEPEEKVVNPTAEQIIEQGRQRRIKEVLYCGGTVYAYGMTRPEAAAYRAECIEAAGSVAKDMYRDERLVMHMIRNAAGARIFNVGHLTQLADFSEAAFAPLFNACAEVNGWTAAAEDQLRKNSEMTRSDASGSGSPPTGGSA